MIPQPRRVDEERVATVSAQRASASGRVGSAIDRAGLGALDVTRRVTVRLVRLPLPPSLLVLVLVVVVCCCCLARRTLRSRLDVMWSTVVQSASSCASMRSSDAISPRGGAPAGSPPSGSTGGCHEWMRSRYCLLLNGR